jgi:hypothetical protein
LSIRQCYDFDLNQQHDSAFAFDEGVGISAYYGKNLLGSHWLTVFAQVKSLTIDHVSNLLRTHSPACRSKTINYSFLDFHTPKLTLFGDSAMVIISKRCTVVIFAYYRARNNALQRTESRFRCTVLAKNDHRARQTTLITIFVQQIIVPEQIIIPEHIIISDDL